MSMSSRSSSNLTLVVVVAVKEEEKSAQIKFMLGATYNQSPTPANLARWKVAGSDKCRVWVAQQKAHWRMFFPTADRV